MKLLTLNTHSLIEPDYEAKRDAFVNFIAKEQPDVFALQEVNQTAAAPLLAGVPAGYYPCPGNMVLLKADNHAAAVARMLEEADCAYHWSWLPAKIGYDRYDDDEYDFDSYEEDDDEDLSEDVLADKEDEIQEDDEDEVVRSISEALKKNEDDLEVLDIQDVDDVDDVKRT